MTVELSFFPSEADHLAVQRLVFRRGLARHKFWVRATLALVVAAAAMTILVRLAGESDAVVLRVAIGSAVGGVAALAIIVGGSWLLLPRRSRRWYAQARTLHHVQHQRWSAEGLYQRSERGDCDDPWDAFYGWHIGREAIIVYASELLVYFLPRRVVTDEQLAAIERMLVESGLRRR